jgi:dual specificity MAP kinase phosphatase
MAPSLSVDYNCTKMLDHLYLGGHEVTTEREMMRDTLKITHIINVTTESDCHFLDDFKYLHVRLADSPDRNKADLLGVLDQAFACIEEARNSEKGAALVHCSVGMSRSASVAIAYLMRFQQMTLYDAFVFTKTKRPVTAPNCGFMEQLIEYERRLFGGVISFSLDKYKENRFNNPESFALQSKK